MNTNTLAANIKGVERTALRNRYKKLYKRWQEFGCQTNPWTVNIVKQLVEIKARLDSLQTKE